MLLLLYEAYLKLERQPNNPSKSNLQDIKFKTETFKRLPVFKHIIIQWQANKNDLLLFLCSFMYVQLTTDLQKLIINVSLP